MTLVVGKIKELSKRRDGIIDAIKKPLQPADTMRTSAKLLVLDNDLIAALKARVSALEEEGAGLRSTLDEVETGLRAKIVEVDSLRSRIEELAGRYEGAVTQNDSAWMSILALVYAIMGWEGGHGVDDKDIETAIARAISLRSSLSSLRRSSERAIEVTRELCSCGGSAPDDPKACDACKIYHVLRASRPAEKGGAVVQDKCPDALLPDGPVCPRCGGQRAPSGSGGGSWVHFTPPSGEGGEG